MPTVASDCGRLTPERGRARISACAWKLCRSPEIWSKASMHRVRVQGLNTEEAQAVSRTGRSCQTLVTEVRVRNTQELWKPRLPHVELKCAGVTNYHDHWCGKWAIRLMPALSETAKATAVSLPMNCPALKLLEWWSFRETAAPLCNNVISPTFYSFVNPASFFSSPNGVSYVIREKEAVINLNRVFFLKTKLSLSLLLQIKATKFFSTRKKN